MIHILDVSGCPAHNLHTSPGQKKKEQTVWGRQISQKEQNAQDPLGSGPGVLLAQVVKLAANPISGSA